MIDIYANYVIFEFEDDATGIVVACKSGEPKPGSAYQEPCTAEEYDRLASLGLEVQRVPLPRDAVGWTAEQALSWLESEYA
ncbi:MAG: hypothetical protein R3B52_01235 [Candidatus Paceibacterota bacterium]